MNALQRRQLAFANMSNQFTHEKPSELIAAHQIDENLFKRLQVATAIYMSKCLPGNQTILDETELLEQFSLHYNEIKNVTPNGMIVPKRHTLLEYNMLVQAFASVMDSLNINDYILSWHIPLNLRIKFAEVNQENLTRHHPTEHIHSDSWAGESSESVTTHLPVFGDTQKNCVLFYDPPNDFEESWLGPKSSYLDGQEIAQKYTKLNFIPKKGSVVLADFSTLHASSRFPGCGSRVTIDTTFHMKRPITGEEVIHPWRVAERTSHHILKSIGETHLFVFPDKIDHVVDSHGGFKHPTNLSIIEVIHD